MINKTSSIPFLKFGEVFDYDYIDSLDSSYETRFLDVTNKTIDTFLQSDDDFYIRAIKGCIMLVIYEEKSGTFNEFMIHRTAKIGKGQFYNFIAISEECNLHVRFKPTVTIVGKVPNRSYIYKEIKPTFSVNEILSYYYSIRSSDYISSGERNNDWELTFVDNGTLHTLVNDEKFTLNQYDLMLYSPGQYHEQWMDDGQTSSYLTIIFHMDIKYGQIFDNTVFHANKDMVNVINKFVDVTKENDYYAKDLLLCYLQEILIQLVRAGGEHSHKTAVEDYSPMKQQFENELLDEILLYISENICKPLSIQDLCEKFCLSRSSLQTLFNNNLNQSPKQYISDLKLKKSKELIRLNKYSVSEISDMIGFASIHYFSRVFKQKYKITPSDYAKTIFD